MLIVLFSSLASISLHLSSYLTFFSFSPSSPSPPSLQSCWRLSQTVLNHCTRRGPYKRWLKNTGFCSFYRQANRIPRLCSAYECLFLSLILLSNNCPAGHRTKNPGIFQLYPQTCFNHTLSLKLFICSLPV